MRRAFFAFAALITAGSALAAASALYAYSTDTPRAAADVAPNAMALDADPSTPEIDVTHSIPGGTFSLGVNVTRAGIGYQGYQGQWNPSYSNYGATYNGTYANGYTSYYNGGYGGGYGRFGGYGGPFGGRYGAGYGDYWAYRALGGGMNVTRADVAHPMTPHGMTRRQPLRVQANSSSSSSGTSSWAATTCGGPTSRAGGSPPPWAWPGSCS